MSVDPLTRFIDAQDGAYDTALAEIKAGRKRSHWMWFIFPQLRGLGRSPTAQYFGIGSLDEARAYLAHPLLGERYRTCVEALENLSTRDAQEVFGSIDALKLRSSLTLFEAAEPSPLVARALDQWFGGHADEKTRDMLGL
jgi:Uncharacterized conserved protein